MLGWWTLFLDLSNSSFLPFYHHNAWERKFWTVTIGNNEIKLSRSRLPSLCKLASSDQMSCPQEKFSSSPTSQSFQTSGTRQKARARGRKTTIRRKAQIKIVRPNLFSFPHQAILSQVQITFGDWKDFFTPEQIPYFPQNFPNWKISEKDEGNSKEKKHCCLW